MQKNISCEIISVGTELLLGDITNTNTAYLARRLAVLGIPVYRQTVVGDNAARLTQALEEAYGRSELVILTGGLGPTCDDITKETVADYFSLPMEEDAPTREAIESFFHAKAVSYTHLDVYKRQIRGRETEALPKHINLPVLNIRYL